MDTLLVPERKNRLIVLIPDCMADNIELAHKIHWMAIREQCDVLYLTLVDDRERMLAVSRCMATIKAATAGTWVGVETQLTETARWFQTLKEVFRPGDRIVCHEEQTVKVGFLNTLPIREFLPGVLEAPVYTLSGYYHPVQVQVRGWLHYLLYWAGLLVIMVIFTGIEIELEQVIHGAARTMLLIFVVMNELGVIWAWHNISNR